MELINVFDDLKNDMSIENIIKKYKIGLPRLIKIVKNYNNTDIDFEEKISKEIYDLRKQGYSYERISKICNASKEFIKNYIEKYCTTNKLDIHETKAVREKMDLPMGKIYDMKKSGVSIDIISWKYNVSGDTIRSRLKEYCAENNLDVTEIILPIQKVVLPMHEIYDMKKSGISIEKISRKYNVNNNTIRRRLKKYCAENNLEFPKNELDLPAEEIYIMRKGLISIKEIAKKYNVGSQTIYIILKEYCKENNLDVSEIMYLERKNKLPKHEIYNMRKSLIPVKEIAKKYNVGSQTIYIILKEYCKENNLDVSEIMYLERKNKLPKHEIYNMRKSLIPVKEIAKKYNVSSQTIYNKLKEINLELLLYLFQSIIDKENDKSINHFIEKEIGYAKQMKDH